VLSGGGTDTHVAAVNVNNTASVWLDKQEESFNLPPGGSSGSPKGVTVDSNTGGAISWTASESSPWLTLVNSSGTGGQQVTFNASASGLTPGVRTATVTVQATGYQSRSFTVTMNVLASGSCPSPNNLDVAVGTPFSLTFDAAIPNTVAAVGGSGTGFTCVQATSDGAGYLASNLSLDTSAGTLSIATTPGIADLTEDSQDNALGVGFDGSGSTQLSTTLLSPPWQGNGGFEQAGVWVGTTERTYVKAVLIDTAGGNAVQLRSEELNVALGTVEAVLPAAAPGSLTLILTINDATNTASMSYSIDGGAPVALGNTVPVSQFVFNGIDPDGSGPSGNNTLGGIFATHRNGTQKTYTFGDFSVSK
jgi:hypothetical protein